MNRHKGTWGGRGAQTSDGRALSLASQSLHVNLAVNLPVNLHVNLFTYLSTYLST